MSFHVRPGSAPTIEYAGRPMEILAGLQGRPSGFAVAQLTVPPGFPGPPPHAHDLFDEGIYVLEGSILVVGDSRPVETGPGSLFVAPRGERHGFAPHHPLQAPHPPDSAPGGRPGGRHRVLGRSSRTVMQGARGSSGSAT